MLAVARLCADDDLPLACHACDWSWLFVVRGDEPGLGVEIDYDVLARKPHNRCRDLDYVFPRCSGTIVRIGLTKSKADPRHNRPWLAHSVLRTGQRVDMYHIMQPSPGSVENPSTANVDCAPPRLALCDSSVQHRRCPEVPLSVCAFHLSMI